MTHYPSVKAWVKALAYSPDDIVLGPFTTLDPEGYASLHALLDLADPSWRDVFAPAPSAQTGEVPFHRCDSPVSGNP